MTKLEQSVRQAKHRLWINRWLGTITWSVTFVSCLYAAVVLMQRSFDLPLPLFGIGLGLAGVALLTAGVWAGFGRETDAIAAARLDEAAGLRERLSTGLYCRGSDDPYAKAVVADAETRCSSLTPARHIRVRLPKSGWVTVTCLAAAALMFLLQPGWLRGPEAELAAAEEELAVATKVAVKKKLDAVARMTEENPALKDLQSELKEFDAAVTESTREPAGIRHEAVKKIDRLADAVRDKRKDAKYAGARELGKMMRGLKTPESSEAPTQKLAQALQKGDLKEARKELKSLKEMLATLQFDEDKELVAKLNKQLEDLAKQLEELARNDKMMEKLEQAGLNKEEAERLLQNLRTEDLDQVRKALENSGLSQEQINKLLEKLAQNKLARDAAQKLAQGMMSAAGAAAAGRSADAVAGLSMAEGQLGDLEMLEQEMNALDGVMAELQDARNDLDKPCAACKGTGMRGGQPCGRCNGRGSGRGGGPGTNPGQGRGGLAGEQETDVSFTKERVKVHTGKGAIIGQVLVEGEQAKGEVTTALAGVAQAAERAASDRINRDRVPRQYQPAVKAYFATVKEFGTDSKPESEGADHESVERDGG